MKNKRNYLANAAAVALAPIKGRLCGARRGGNINCSAKCDIPDQGMTRKKR